MFGHEPSEGAKYTLDYLKKKIERLSNENKINLLELGAGLGRDTGYFITESNIINITAVDYSVEAIKNINKKKLDSKRVDTKVWDVRNGLPFKENSFDGCFSHMLYCCLLYTSPSPRDS